MRCEIVKAWAGLVIIWLAVGVSVCAAGGRFPDEADFFGLFDRAKIDAAPPFELPDSIPGGGVKMFHRARSQASYAYSQGGRIRVYRYDTAEAAAEDLAVFAKAAERLDEKTSSVLAKLGACVERQKEHTTLWFSLNTTVVGIQLPPERWSAPAVVKVAEGLVKAESERMAKAFGEPERAVATFLKAVEKADEPMIMRSLWAGDDEEIRKRLEQARVMLPMLRFAALERMGEVMGVDNPLQPARGARVGRAETTADGRVVVPVRTENPGNEMSWYGLLMFAAGKERLIQPGATRRGEPLWIPMAKVGDYWAIDLPALSVSMFSKTFPQKGEHDCLANLRQILLALKAAASNSETQKFPDKLSTLVTEEYVRSPKIFCAPNTTTKIEKAADVDEKSDYVYEGAGMEDDGDGDLIIIYEKPVVHQGKGRHVGFADGHIQWFDEDTFKKLLDAQREALRTGNRPAKPKPAGAPPAQPVPVPKRLP